MNHSTQRVTRVLQDCVEKGDGWDALLPLVYDELHGLARRRMAGERAEHTLQATALVSEAYLRLVGDREMDWESRRHFYGAAAEAMRRVLVDHARKCRAQRRGGDRERMSLTVLDLAEDGDPDVALALADGLEVLAREDERAAEVARLRYLVGLSVEETAATLEVSERTVMREWAYARARLGELMRDAPAREEKGA